MEEEIRKAWNEIEPVLISNCGRIQIEDENTELEETLEEELTIGPKDLQLYFPKLYLYHPRQYFRWESPAIIYIPRFLLNTTECYINVKNLKNKEYAIYSRLQNPLKYLHSRLENLEVWGRLNEDLFRRKKISKTNEIEKAEAISESFKIYNQ